VSQSQIIIAAATLLGAGGMWLLLPRGTSRGRAAGLVLAAASAGLLASQMSWVAPLSGNVVFAVIASVTVGAAVATVTFQSPIYCAVWFGLTLLGTAGLFLLQGAQFLAVATVVVYAGAILVTFLFVLMLAQPEGRTYYDRLSWEAPVAAVTGAVMVGILTMTVVAATSGDRLHAAAPVAPAQRLKSGGVLCDQHVAEIGRQLFGSHLIAVEVAGTLLLVALVGAAAMVAQAKSPPGSPPAPQSEQTCGPAENLDRQDTSGDG